MIFADLAIQDLHQLLLPHMDEPLWPGVKSDAVKQRARDYARKNGTWARLENEIAPDKPIPSLRFSEYEGYRRTGSRQPYQGDMEAFEEATHLAALGLWLDHPIATLDRLQDLMWQWCGSNWTPPAHEGMHIELASSRVGRMLAEYNWLFSDRLEKPLKARVAREIDTRMLDVALDWRRQDWWTTTSNNWNIVCNAELAQIALYQVRDAGSLATLVHTLCRRLDYAIAYFSSEGLCPEGPAYWEYGFTQFLNLAIALRQRTGGRVDLTADEHVRKICLAPLATQFGGNARATFADASNDDVKIQTAMKVQNLIGSSALFRYVETTADGFLPMDHIRTFALFDGQQFDPSPDRNDYFMPDLGYVKLNGGTGRVLAALAGNNGVSHNHNDVGSFIFVVNGKPVLTDPGSPLYTSKTFGPDRYELLFCRSKGHSVPLINGHEQGTGSQFSGTMEVANPNSDGEKLIRIDMTAAYADPTLRQLKRELVLSSASELRITDSYRFNSVPTSIEEAFVTFENVVLADDGQSAKLGESAATLKALSPGRLACQLINPEQHEGADRRPLTRISFQPARIDAEMQIAFTCCGGN